MKIFTKMTVLALAAVAMTACSDDQTTFDVQSVPGRATVQGTVNCNYGATYNNGRLEYNIKPVAGLKVLLTVDNNQYGDNLTGETVFETETDENGTYMMEIPTTNKGVNVKIRTASFSGTRTVVDRVNNKIETREEKVVFGTTNSGSAFVKSYGMEYENVTCGVTSVDEATDGYNFYATLDGLIGRNAEEYIAPAPEYDWYGEEVIGYTDAMVKEVFEPAPNADLIVRVTYGSVNYVFNATTDRKGEFSIDVPVTGFPADFSYSVETMPVEAVFNTFVRNDQPTSFKYQGVTYQAYDMTAYPVKGFYTQTTFSKGSNRANFPIQNYIQKFDLKAMVFEPLPEEETYGYNPNRWTEYTPWAE